MSGVSGLCATNVVRLDSYDIKQGGDVFQHFGGDKIEYYEYGYDQQNIDRIMKIVHELFLPLIHCLLSCMRIAQITA